MGRTVLPFEPEIIFSEDFLVLNANGDTLKKDFWNGALWMPDITNSQQSTFHKYVLEVSDKDF